MRSGSGRHGVDRERSSPSRKWSCSILVMTDGDEPNEGEGSTSEPGYHYMALGGNWVRMPYPKNRSDQLVWHYTDSRALINIIKTSSVWASSPRTLNDSSEIEYGQEIVRRAVEDYRGAISKGSSVDRFLSLVLPEDVGVDILQTCMVFCASKDPDSLNQWQHYSRAQGYAVGLRRAHRLLKADGTLEQRVNYALGWLDVIYDSQAQSDLVYSMLEWMIQHYKPALEGHEAPPVAAAQFHMRRMLSYCVLAFKHRGFQAEQEVRYLVEPSGDTPLFRSGARGIIPYMERKFHRDVVETDNYTASFAGVVCGPGQIADQEADVINVKLLLAAHSYPQHVTKSEVPYRF